MTTTELCVQRALELVWEIDQWKAGLKPFPVYGIEEAEVLFPRLGINLDWPWERKKRRLRQLRDVLDKMELCRRWRDWRDELSRW